MGLFSFFKKKTDEELLKDRAKEIAPLLFPGGHSQILETGQRISTMLDGRMPAEAASRLFSITKYFAYTSVNKSRENVVAYMLRASMGLLDEAQAGAIYDKFILEKTEHKSELSTVLQAFEEAEIDVVLETGNPTGIFVQVSWDAEQLRQAIKAHETAQKVVSTIERRIKGGDLNDESLRFSRTLGTSPDLTKRYLGLKRVALSSDGVVMFTYSSDGAKAN